MFLLPISFFVTAVLYAAVGFGGGSTYNALLILVGIDYQILPVIALLCNIIVVSGGTYYFYRAGHIDIKRIAPWIITSVPAAWIGGYLSVSETLFIGILGFSLLVSGLRMLYTQNNKTSLITLKQYKLLPPVIGTGLGLLAGIVGIGGGIFLAPILYLLRWGGAKEIAATCSVFIFVNSLSGLIGQAMKMSSTAIFSDLNTYWLLFPAVLIGGQIGSRMGAKILNPKVISLMTAMLILYVSARLILRWWSLIT